MAESLLLVAAYLCGQLGMACLALTLRVHFAQTLGGQSPTPRGVQVLRLLGAVGLMGALLLCFVANHASMAPLVWVMMLGVWVVAVAFTLTYRPRALRMLAKLVSG